MSDDPTFFHVQDRLLGVLLAWGIGSVAGGAPGLLSRNPVLRQAGVQSIAWGAIDAALALLGRRSARASIRRGATDGPHQARRFRTILLINTVLDAGYVAGGWALVRGAKGRGERVGMGLGIMTQGLFLLLYDSALAAMVGRWTREVER